VRFRLERERLHAELMGVADADDPGSAVEVLARYVVDAGRPGPQPA
jgi:hypothetical protein